MIQFQIDCSHGNSSKQHQRQVIVADSIVCPVSLVDMSLILIIFFQASQLEYGDTADKIMGVMIESNLVEGRQDIPPSGPSGLKYGQSVTDACISQEQTEKVLDRLREGVQGRRENVRRRARGLEEIKPPVSDEKAGDA